MRKVTNILLGCILALAIAQGRFRKDDHAEEGCRHAPAQGDGYQEDAAEG